MHTRNRSSTRLLTPCLIAIAAIPVGLFALWDRVPFAAAAPCDAGGGTVSNVSGQSANCTGGGSYESVTVSSFSWDTTGDCKRSVGATYTVSGSTCSTSHYEYCGTTECDAGGLSSTSGTFTRNKFQQCNSLSNGAKIDFVAGTDCDCTTSIGTGGGGGQVFLRVTASTANCTTPP